MKHFFIPYIYILFSFFFLNKLHAQEKKSYSLEITSITDFEKEVLRKINYKKKFKSKDNLLNEIKSTIIFLQKEGYYTLIKDSISITKKKHTTYLSLGPKTIKAIVKIPSTKELQFLNNTYNIENNNLKLEINQLNTFINTINKHLEKEGFSFSKVKLINTNIKNNILHSNLTVSQLHKRVIDSIIIKGYNNFPKNFKTHFYNIKKKKPFNNDNIEKLSKQTQQLKFAKEFKKPEVLFSKDSTLLYMYLKKQKANSFDGLINFSSKKEKKGISFNGYLDLNLINTFNTGEKISIKWKNNGNDKQFFKFNVLAPYIFNSKITSKAEFNLYRNDSTYTNSNIDLGFSFPINPKTHIGLIMNSETSNYLLETSTNVNIADFDRKMIGSFLSYNSLKENQFNIYSQILYGNRHSSQKSTRQFKINLNSSILIKLNKKLQLFLKNTLGYLNSKNQLENELFRIGGQNSIRGFDEQSILTHQYTFFNSEFRFSGKNASYFYNIFDVGTIKNLNTNQNLYSFGIGYKRITKDNSLNINYVIGKKSDNSFNLNTSKIGIEILTFF